MGFRFQRRINLGRGLGINVSGSGVSVSQRTGFGMLGRRGVSIRSGLPGLTYRGGRRSRGGIFALVLLLFSVGWPLVVGSIGLDDQPGLQLSRSGPRRALP